MEAMDSLDVTMRELEEKPLNGLVFVKFLWTLSRYFAPNTIKTLVVYVVRGLMHRYALAGGKKKEWPLFYTLVRSWLTLGFTLLDGSHHRKKSIALESTHESQSSPDFRLKRHTIATPTAFSTQITSHSFPTHADVLAFVLKRAPGEGHGTARALVTTQAELTVVKKAQDDVLVYLLHGGGYVFGSHKLYRFMAERIGKYAQAKVFAIDYRLAPDYPFPCALIDALSGYFYLLERFPDKKIVLMGDSAGGGLSIATMLALRDMGCGRMPVGAFLLSPWVDLTHSMPSIHSNHAFDYLPALRVVDPNKGNRLHYYAPDHLLKTPYVSPLFADLSDLPPMLIQVGQAEKLYDEDVAFAGRVCGSSSRVQLEEYSAHVHVFQIFASFNHGADVAMKRAGRWIRGVAEAKVNDVFRYTSSHTLLDFDGEVVSKVPPSFISAPYKPFSIWESARL
ncbi:hypothetical protein HDV03_000447 [Kappamyces sp. JEL0829]|nr:hypothetical protein HDV03_000447 [Kappamyces sp. JEL0829]